MTGDVWRDDQDGAWHPDDLDPVQEQPNRDSDDRSIPDADDDYDRDQA